MAGWNASDRAMRIALVALMGFAAADMAASSASASDEAAAAAVRRVRVIPLSQIVDGEDSAPRYVTAPTVRADPIMPRVTRAPRRDGTLFASRALLASGAVATTEPASGVWRMSVRGGPRVFALARAHIQAMPWILSRRGYAAINLGTGTFSAEPTYVSLRPERSIMDDRVDRVRPAPRRNAEARAARSRDWAQGPDSTGSLMPYGTGRRSGGF